MKFNKLICLTVLVVGIGFFLPAIAAAVQDRYIDGQISQQDLASIDVAIESNDEDGIIDALKLVVNSKAINLNNTDEAQSLAIKETVLADLSLFSDSGLDGIDVNLYQSYICKAEKYSLVSPESTAARVYWKVCFYESETSVQQEQPVVTIMLDDNSKKIVAFAFDNISTGFEQDMQQTWADTLTDYYGFKGNQINSSEITGHFGKDEYPIQFYDDSGEEVSASFIKGESNLWFNYLLLN